MKRVIDKLREAGLQFALKEEADAETPAATVDSYFSGKTVVLTGSLNGYTREECRALIEKHGGSVASGVSSRTDIVVAGEKAGSKLARAEELGIEVMSEEKMEAVCGNQPAPDPRTFQVSGSVRRNCRQTRLPVQGKRGPGLKESRSATGPGAPWSPSPPSRRPRVREPEASADRCRPPPVSSLVIPPSRRYSPE